ncbi:MAG: glycosyltransferase family 4 protein [Pirellulaceae bacterium]|nr:glycosyltransferase family 4 protein [Pirellulaceae bacterium]
MRALVIHRYFWPDTPPYASMLRRIGEHWIAGGHSVQVFSTQPSYKVEVANEQRPKREKLGELEVVRCSLIKEKSRSGLLRAVNSLLFAIKVFLHILGQRGKWDVIMCSTVPPVLVGMATSLGAKLTGAKFVYHAMDIWPEVGTVADQLKPGVVYRLMRWLDTRTCLRSSAIVCLSEDMRASYVARDARMADRIHVINNFDLPDYAETKPVAAILPKVAGKFRVIFAGNVGRYQSLDTVLQAAERLRDRDDIEFVFVGDGAAKSSLQSRAKELGMLDKSVYFVPHQPVAVAKQMIAEADVALVSLAPEVIKYAYPSKTMTYLALGSPLAVVVELDSELARTVQQAKLGIVVGPGEPGKLADEIVALCGQREELTAMRARCLEYSQAKATPEVLLQEWDRLLAGLR